MPIEIRELVIRAHIEAPAMEADEHATMQYAYEHIVSDCVEAVLQVLKEKNER
jgi:hypothetical protein